MTVPRRSPRGVHRGFTLIEALVATAILAVLAALAFSGLKLVLDSRTRLIDKDRSLASLQKAVALLRSDLRTALARPVRDEVGARRPALAGGGSFLLELTRSGGRGNPSGLRRVAYVLDGGSLVRLAWDTLDRAPGSEPTRQPLISRISRLTSRFRGDQAWSASWPPATAGSPDGPLLPRAMELAFDTEDGGRYRFVFLVGD